jgi:hypothetical protein
MFNTRQDLNIFYSGGSGGFILLHLLLLKRQHLVIFHTYLSYKWYNNWLQSQTNNPEFTEYIDKNITLLPDEIPLDPTLIVQHKTNALTRYENYLQVMRDFYEIFLDDVVFKQVFPNQWDPNRSTWKESEIWPDNKVTGHIDNLTSFNKLFFTCNKVKEWQDLPGHKVLLYTDIRSQVRLAWFKKANWFIGCKTSLVAKRPLLRRLFSRSLDQDVITAWDYADLKITLQELINDSRWNAVETDLINQWKQQHPELLLRKIGIL